MKKKELFHLNQLLDEVAREMGIEIESEAHKRAVKDLGERCAEAAQFDWVTLDAQLV